MFFIAQTYHTFQSFPQANGSKNLAVDSEPSVSRRFRGGQK